MVVWILVIFMWWIDVMLYFIYLMDVGVVMIVFGNLL